MKKGFWNNKRGEAMVSSIILATMLASVSLSLPAINGNVIPKELSTYEELKIDKENYFNAIILNRKLDKLKRTIIDNKKDILKQKQFIVIDSICDGKNQATVISAYNKDFETAYEEAKNDILSEVLEKNINPAWVKLDISRTMSGALTLGQLKTKISKASNGGFHNGIMLEYSGDKIAILESELNYNSIIDYNADTLNLDELNKYLERRGYDKLEKLPEKYYTFSTTSYFCDENDVIYPLYDSGISIGRRITDELSIEEAKEVYRMASDYLITQMQKNGRFVYGYSANKDTVLSGYNSVRHSGTIWSLVNCYEEDSKNSTKCKEVIDKAIGYLISLISKKSDDIYHFKYSNGKICLGMDALSLVALSEYTDKFKDDTYLETCKKIGNGIIDIQKEDGRFIHLLKDGTYETLQEFQTAFYDGEAILGLCKLYKVTQDEKYLNAAKKAFDYCIDNNYLKHHDHWLEYSANELTKYTNEEKYFAFGLQNIDSNLESMRDRKSTAHTDFEKLMQGYELYRRIIDNNIHVEYLKEFPEEAFVNAVKYRAGYQLNSFCFPEVVMYWKNPQKYVGAFFIKGDNYRIRIDDVQHSMTGYLYYSRNF